MRYDLEKLDKALPAVLVNQLPARPNHPAEALVKPDKQEKPLTCPGCGGQAKKNGAYWVLNWVLMLTMGWQGLIQVLIQRWRCKRCGRELISSERARQAEARQAWWQQVNRLIALSRFKLRLSVRLVQVLVTFVYARGVSVGHIERVTQRTGQQAKGALGKLKQCRQAVAHFLLFDKTYPKMKDKGYSLGGAICEHGLLRSVRCLTRKAKYIPAQLGDLVGEHFQPTYFLTDLDVLHYKHVQGAGLNLTHLRHKVHLIRQVVRLFDQAVRDVTLGAPKGFSVNAKSSGNLNVVCYATNCNRCSLCFSRPSPQVTKRSVC